MPGSDPRFPEQSLPPKDNKPKKTRQHIPADIVAILARHYPSHYNDHHRQVALEIDAMYRQSERRE